MNRSINLMVNEWQSFRNGQRAALGMTFSCSRYRGEVTAQECREAAKPLCMECATGHRLRTKKAR